MSARQASIVFAIGSDQPAGTTDDGRPQYRGCTDLHLLFDKREPVHILKLDKHALRQRKRPELHPYRCILNLITDPDQNPRTLDNLKKLLREYSGKVINPPEAVLRSTRDRGARLLDGTAGLIAPKVVRLRNARPELAVGAVERGGMNYPLIVRKAGTHTGMIVGLVHTPDELRSSIVEPGEHIITEFVDFRSEDGLYRKYRAFFIGEKIIFRHMLVSDDWNIHARDRMRFMAERPYLLDEERAMFARVEGTFPPEVIETLAAIRNRMGLDYFGIDFGTMLDGRVVLFEANATMNFLPFLPDPQFEYVKACYLPAKQAFHEMLGCVRPEYATPASALAVAR